MSVAPLGPCPFLSLLELSDEEGPSPSETESSEDDVLTSPSFSSSSVSDSSEDDVSSSSSSLSDPDEEELLGVDVEVSDSSDDALSDVEVLDSPGDELSVDEESSSLELSDSDGACRFLLTCTLFAASMGPTFCTRCAWRLIRSGCVQSRS